jgi:NAD(P)H-quinone oxidoreductase subunit 5
MTLTVAPGLVQFLVGWMATSLGLHKLLIYFPDRRGTLLSARKKAVLSRIGDVCLIAAFVGIYQHFGTQDFGTLFAMVEGGAASMSGITWAAWLIALGALLKSAQFPFHTWLPDTMGAPTPVSALMHAGIINGGGYLIIRLSPLIVSVPGALGLLAIVGMLTAVYASMVMLTQTSVKRALAYSTIAQMGFMMLQCGLGAFHLAALHIIAHSLYKAHTFLASGTAVETAQKLNADPATLSLPQNKIWVAVMPSLLIVIVLSVLFGMSPENKPGMLVLSLVVVMALTHWLWVQMRRGVKGTAWVAALSWAALYGTIYFALAKAASLMLAEIAPDVRAVSLGFELLMVFLLAVFLLTSIRFQDGEPGFLSVAFKRRLYVHALNGFYMNTLINSLARKVGLVPKGR